jgi:predicted metalloprotease with PDZ domain
VLLVAAALPWLGGAHPGVATELSYRIVLRQRVQPIVHIELSVVGGDSGATWFEVSREWGGVDAGGDDLTNAVAFGDDGSPLPVSHPAPHRWRVEHRSSAVVRFAYDIATNPHQEDSAPSVHRRPIVNDRLFHCYGELGLVRPGGSDPHQRRRVSVAWENFDSFGWGVASSFGVGDRPRTFLASLEQLRNSVWLAGDLDLVRREIRGRELWLAVQRAEWSFSLDAFTELAHRIVATERDFFHDFDTPFYLISLVPVGREDTRSRSMGGTGLTDSFSLCMLPDTPLRGDLGEGMDVAALLAHEMFHEWAGQTVRPAQPEQLCYWFTEGFTEYYTRRLLLRGGLISLEEFTRAVNRTLAELWTSSVRNAPNQRIESEFWTDAEVKRLPYLRGDVVAMLANRAVRVRSGGRRSLDDLMRQWVREARRGGGDVSTASLLAAIEAAAGGEAAAQLRSIVVDGTTPAIPADLFGACATIDTFEATPYVLGFDFARSRKEGAVVGVVDGSAAHHAGLRDGMKVVRWSVTFGDPTRPVLLTVEEGGARREIRYEPRGAAVPTPRVTVADPGAPRDCSGP